MLTSTYEARSDAGFRVSGPCDRICDRFCDVTSFVEHVDLDAMTVGLVTMSGAGRNPVRLDLPHFHGHTYGRMSQAFVSNGMDAPSGSSGC